MNDAIGARERGKALLAALDEPDGLLGDVIDDAEAEVAERLGLALKPVVELQIRLQGERAVRGFYDPEVEAELSGPLGKQLSAALGKARRSTRLGLVQIGEGSVILHYRVMELDVDDAGDESKMVDVGAADTAVREVLRLHRMFESRASAAEVASFGDRHSGLLKAARGVVDALSKFELAMSSTWRSPGGEWVRSVLTESGRTWAQALFQQMDKTEPVPVVGKVAVLDIDGSVTIAVSGKTRFTIAMEPEQVDGFALGEPAAVWAEVTTPQDQVGLKGRAKYRFSHHMEPEDTLEFEDS